MAERSIVIHSPHGTRSVRFVTPRPCQKTRIPPTNPPNKIAPKKKSHAIQGVITSLKFGILLLSIMDSFLSRNLFQSKREGASGKYA
jgi:hypothetical protein